jgi:hypothetical protein
MLGDARPLARTHDVTAAHPRRGRVAVATPLRSVTSLVFFVKGAGATVSLTIEMIPCELQNRVFSTPDLLGKTAGMRPGVLLARALRPKVPPAEFVPKSP